MSGRPTAGGVGDAIAAATDALRAVGIEDARLDAEVLFAHAAGWDRARIAADAGAEVPAASARRFAEMVRRRLRREPVAYIVGRRWFRNIELSVDPRVLIPRPETELLVELALELRPDVVLDVGTGCGSVALAIADELQGCKVTATDTSAAALEVARANSERLGLADRVRFHGGTVPDAWSAARSGPRVDEPGGDAEDAGSDASDAVVERPAPDGCRLVVANLPYVSESEWTSLQPEVTEWEPREALLAGPDGLDAIRAALPDCVRLLSRRPRQRANASTGASEPSPQASDSQASDPQVADRGVLAFEVGAGQAEAVAGLFLEAGLGGLETRRDLAGIERVVVGRTA